ncbi:MULTISPECIES: hypothetical protein [unclassified Pseudomonas]|uniref:hypothetical protein n=1 Tax=unclassified Pseudomonas TaxID=196821 RepID=UPI000C884773|nr:MULTISPECIES: hypothetical protein [unclassified Pseudomonas]PMV19932.1 hypothetical protein C1X17_21645 [Pseudomonas sp. FW305-3-2-15-C-TSA2]PMV45920.1 hypothetical protein C1X16_12200 [Pseudomonas sp. FW305-3-2-15-C-R2A1]PMV60455.1 hypothetical protein C1X13_29400 [Pseudomonas sp. GW123-5C08]PMV73357.1 hypothetical protein C1X15_17100 [Pseudomonas sp. GW123-5D08]PMV79079.1 hypothetical protein C1X14_16635 [Pseudomonas sp. FW305-3-2-15-C-TSA3]
MKINFYLEESMGDPTPWCSTDVGGANDVDLLACLLLDDGGLPLGCTISWLDEGLSRIISVRNAEKVFTEWVRETWVADISISEVKVYSLHDEEFAVTISLDDFEKALLGWRNFVVSFQQGEKFLG